MMTKSLRIGVALGMMLLTMPVEAAPSPQAVRDAEGVVKLIINLNHHLCARITYVEPTSEAGVFHVRCIKNIGGRSSVDYLVNGKANTAVRI